MYKIEDVPAHLVPDVAGAPVAGGFLVKRYLLNGEEYAEITAGKAGEVQGKWGEYGLDIPGAHSRTDGWANTLAMAEAKSPIAIAVRALDIGGKTDWFIGACDQVEMQYRELKPTIEQNYCSFRDGDNQTTGDYPYTEDSPTQTAAEAFKEGGEQAMVDAVYWTSTQYSPYTAYIQAFVDGFTYYYLKGHEWRAQAVRTIHIVH